MRILRGRKAVKDWKTDETCRYLDVRAGGYYCRYYNESLVEMRKRFLPCSDECEFKIQQSLERLKKLGRSKAQILFGAQTCA